jgi:hypothetical protein
MDKFLTREVHGTATILILTSQYQMVIGVPAGFQGDSRAFPCDQNAHFDGQALRPQEGISASRFSLTDVK